MTFCNSALKVFEYVKYSVPKVTDMGYVKKYFGNEDSSGNGSTSGVCIRI